MKSCWLEGEEKDKGKLPTCGGGQYWLEVWEVGMLGRLGDCLGVVVVDGSIACDYECAITGETKQLNAKIGAAAKNTNGGGSVTMSCVSVWKKGADPNDSKGLSMKATGVV